MTTDAQIGVAERCTRGVYATSALSTLLSHSNTHRACDQGFGSSEVLATC